MTMRPLSLQQIEELERLTGNYRINHYDAVPVALPEMYQLLAAARRGIEGWQPIETAPRDGSEIWLWDGQHRILGYWSAWARDENGDVVGIPPEDQAICVDCWTAYISGDPLRTEPVKWQPLPAPPPRHSEGEEDA